MNIRSPYQRLDGLEQRLDEQALHTLICLCPAYRTLNPAQQEAIGAAIHERVAPAIEQVRRDTQLAPCLGQAAFYNAVLTLALAGLKALQASVSKPKHRSTTRKTHHAQPIHHH
jgi:hypothetical protein